MERLFVHYGVSNIGNAIEDIRYSHYVSKVALIACEFGFEVDAIYIKRTLTQSKTECPTVKDEYVFEVRYLEESGVSLKYKCTPSESDAFVLRFPDSMLMYKQSEVTSFYNTVANGTAFYNWLKKNFDWSQVPILIKIDHK